MSATRRACPDCPYEHDPAGPCPAGFLDVRAEGGDVAPEGWLERAGLWWRRLPRRRKVAIVAAELFWYAGLLFWLGAVL